MCRRRRNRRSSNVRSDAGSLSSCPSDRALSLNPPVLLHGTTAIREKLWLCSSWWCRSTLTSRLPSSWTRRDSSTSLESIRCSYRAYQTLVRWIERQAWCLRDCEGFSVYSPPASSAANRRSFYSTSPLPSKRWSSTSTLNKSEEDLRNQQLVDHQG
ncbi:hypothetical protein BDY24DRAFT_2445 [Mrakia frigida]|uniref:uncharacterized protein n=1 Tax=Mrakia frigida TaxID=29902 RepID=UPI003FCC191D